ALGCRAVAAVAAGGPARPGRAAADRHLALPELPGRAGAEQQPLYAGVLEEAAAAGYHRCAGVRRHFVHLRSAALGYAGPAGVHRGTGWLQFPHSAGPARAIQPGVRILTADRGAAADPHTAADGQLADKAGWVIPASLPRWCGSDQ